MGCPNWHTAMHSLRLQRLLWIYCPGHAGVSGNEQADRLASTADITSGLQLGRAEVLRGLRNFLSTDKPEHHSIDRLKERAVEKGSGRHSTLQGRERSVFNQTNIGTVSRVTLGRLLRDGAERVWAFPSTTMPSAAETETILSSKGVFWGMESEPMLTPLPKAQRRVKPMTLHHAGQQAQHIPTELFRTPIPVKCTPP